MKMSIQDMVCTPFKSSEMNLATVFKFHICPLPHRLFHATEDRRLRTQVMDSKGFVGGEPGGLMIRED